MIVNHSKTLLHQKITSLSKISDASLEKLFETSIQKQLAKGSILLKQRQICKSVFFIEKGYVRTFMDKDGIEINIDFTLEGNFTTNLKSLRNNTPSDVVIQAGEALTVYEFDKDRLLQLYHVSAEIESFGRKLLEQLLIASEEHANLFKMFSPTERYQYLLTDKPEMLQRISLSQLASYLGIARETLSRIRKRNTGKKIM